MKSSAFLKDVKLYNGNGNQITVDEKTLGKVYTDEHGNQARDYSYSSKSEKSGVGVDVLYLGKPTFENDSDEIIPPK